MSNYTTIHVRSKHFRISLLRLLGAHRTVKVCGQPDAIAWQQITGLVAERIISLSSTQGRGFLAVRGPAFARLGRVA